MPRLRSPFERVCPTYDLPVGHRNVRITSMTREDNCSQLPRLWHYTTGVHIPLILDAGKIRAENPSFLRPPQIPVTWFSLNQVWEPTACKVALPPEAGPTIMRRATAEACCGLFRIGVDQSVAPFRVHQLIPIARAERWKVKAYKRVGISFGACPDDWRFTPNEVPEDRWRTIQIWDEASREWLPYQHEQRFHSRRDALVGAFD